MLSAIRFPSASMIAMSEHTNVALWRSMVSYSFSNFSGSQTSSWSQ